MLTNVSRDLLPVFSVSESLPVFPFLLVVEHRQVALVSACGDIMFLYRFQHGTSWFVSMRAVVETAVLREMENLLEVACHLLRLHVESAEPLYSRSINKVSSLRHFNHLAECRGMHTCIVCIAYFRSSQVRPWNDGVYYVRLAYTAVSA